MDEDYDIFEMFQEIIADLDLKEPDGRMRVLSLNPRFNETTESDTDKSKTHKR